MAGPGDARVNPNAINAFSETHSIDWFARNMLSRVPARYVEHVPRMVRNDAGRDVWVVDG